MNQPTAVTSPQKRVLFPLMMTHSQQPVFTLHRETLFGFCLCLLLGLSACTSTPVDQQETSSSTQSQVQQQRFTEGKNFFLSKQYGQAASILLPLAQQGHLDAQYTIGYMYHYGYGLPRNEKESTRWINMAAARGHLHAKKALAQINAMHDQEGVVVESANQPLNK